MSLNDEIDEQDDVIAQLGELPPRDIDPWRAEKIRRRSHEALKRAAALNSRPWRARAVRVYDRVLEPAFVCGVSAVYLAWAISAVSSILVQ